MAQRIKIAVHIARQQIFTKGHEYGLRHCIDNYDLTVVLVGSAFKAPDIDDPFTFQNRAAILDVWFGEQGNPQHAILPLKDQPYNDSKWMQSVQELVAQAVQDKFGIRHNEVDISIVGADRDASTWYLKAFPQWKLDLIPPHPDYMGLSATQMRKRLFEGLDHRDWPEIPLITKSFLDMWRSTDVYRTLVEEYDFIRHYRAQWRGPHEPAFKTVDATVIQSGHVLVVERALLPGKGLIAEPGGFVKPHQRLEDAVIDELMGETGLLLTEGKNAVEITQRMLKGAIQAIREFDHPKHDLRGRFFTTNFLFRLDDTKPLPKVNGQFIPLDEPGGGKIVETKRAFWMPISDARRDSHIWYGKHHGMLDTMLGLVRP